MRVPLPEAAKLLGTSPQGVREHMKRGVWDLGSVVPPKRKGGQWQYHIYRSKLDKHLGLEGMEEVDGYDRSSAGRAGQGNPGAVSDPEAGRVEE